MTIDAEQALYGKLSTTAGITALCSTRIYPLDLPPSVTLPAVTYQIIDAPIEATHDEAAGSSLVYARHQITSWATTYAASVALAKQIHLALQGFKGIITVGADTFTIMSSLRAGKMPNKDPETGLYWISQDYIIWYTE